MKCDICGRRFTILNKFYRKYGFGIVIDMRTGNVIKRIYFCSQDCYNKTIEPKDYKKPFLRFFKENKYWIPLEKSLASQEMI